MMRVLAKANLLIIALTGIVRKVLVNLFAAFALGVTITQAAPGDSWFRELIPTGHSPGPGVSFAIANVVGSSARISANAFFSYIQGRDPVTLHGKQGEDGFFEPNVAYEVATEGKGKWKTLRPRADLDSPDTITVSPERGRIVLRINLQPLETWIGIYRYARLTLENGDSTLIALEDLLPTASARDPLGNFKEDVFGLPRPNVDQPGILSTVISLGDRLIGEFIFEAKGKTVKFEGTRTLDDDFWPLATFEVGDDLKKWILIGKSDNPGTRRTLEVKLHTAESLRFILTGYKSHIGKNRFGKITFPNGRFIVFYLERLDPK